MNARLMTIRDLSHRFGAATVLEDVDLDIEAGSYTVLLGPSGSGKTTLLSILGGFLRPSAGTVLIAGEDCTREDPARRPTATVFQDYALFPHLSVGHNVGFGLMIRGITRAERDREARRLLELVGLSSSFGKKPHQLSGGQRQRVALARALAVKPKVLLLDEPLGALDLKLRRQMQDELKAIQREVGTAFIHVTHDQEEAMALADLIVLMNGGRIEDRGPPEGVYLRPRTRFSATFMGESTILEGMIEGEELTCALGRIALSDGHRPGPAVACIRPENLRIGPDGSPGASLGLVALGAARVETVVFQGSFKRVLARSLADPRQILIARASPERPIEPNALIELSCRAGDVVILDR